MVVLTIISENYGKYTAKKDLLFNLDCVIMQGFELSQITGFEPILLVVE